MFIQRLLGLFGRHFDPAKRRLGALAGGVQVADEFFQILAVGTQHRQAPI